MVVGTNRRALATCAVWLALAARGLAQQTTADPAPLPAEEPSPVQEAGGRLIVSGETVVVTGRDEDTRSSSIATKVDVPLIETPRSVSVVDRRELDAMAAVNISQAHDYTVDFQPLDERGPGSSRGFPIDFYDLRRDGLRTYSWSVREPVALDRIQYLRGPASLLYGDGSPGGLVNLVLKKPLPVPEFEFTASGGELGYGRVTGDATGPLNDRHSGRYRLIGAAEWLDNGIDNNERRLTLMPMVAFDFGPHSTLTADVELYDQRGRNYRHAVPSTADTQHGDFSKIPWDLSIAGPDDGWTGSNIGPGLRLDTALGQNTSLHVAGRYTRIDGDLDLEALVSLAPDGRTVNRYHYREISVWDEYQSDSFVSTTVRTASIQHQLVTGIEAGLSKTNSDIGFGPAAPIDLYAPQYGPKPAEPDLSPTRFDVSRVGVYGTDRLRVTRHVIVDAGLRWSRIDVTDHVAGTSSPNAELTPSVGVVVLPRPSLSFYATYVRGFEAPAAGEYLEGGRPLTPTESRSVEGGVKGALAGGRLTASAAAFRIVRTNIAELDALGFYRQIGEGESHGVELEVAGTVGGGLGIHGGYAWCPTDITQDIGSDTGNALPNAPRHKANVWLQYSFLSGHLSKLSLAGGIVHVGDRFTASNNAAVAAAYTRVDATAVYALAGPRLMLRLTAQNLADTRYVTSGAGSALFAGPPRRVALQLATAF